ncbi:MAG TPA: hypothetical protein VFU36_12220, partial [Jatrophihabitans sp.]|nr:hypothetical protein [Jatrophihabitans sp.]
MPKAATRSVLLAAMLTLGLTGLATTPATAATKPKPKPESPRPPAVSVQRAGGQLAMTSSGRSAVQRPAAAEPPQRTVPPAKPAKAAAPTPPANPPPTGHAQHRTSCPSAGHRRTRAITCVTVVQLDAQTPAPAPPVSSQPLAGTSTRSVVAGGDVPFPQGCTTEYATPSRTLTCRHVMEYWTTRDQQNGDVLGTQALEIWEYWQTDLRTLTIVHGLQVATRETTGTAFASGATVSVSNPCMSSPVMGNGVSCTATEAFTGPDPQYVMPDTFL